MEEQSNPIDVGHNDEGTSEMNSNPGHDLHDESKRKSTEKECVRLRKEAEHQKKEQEEIVRC
jgi:hypothetical protein